MLEHKDRAIRKSALNTLLSTARIRGERSIRASLAFATATAPTGGRRTIFDCGTSTDLTSARIVRTEEGAVSSDEAVNRAFDGLGKTRQFYSDVLARNSIDGRGLRLDGYVHRGISYNNAFWDGQEMVFGDGDGIVFTDFTKSLDVIAHELTHGVTEAAAGLEYHVESGALNESISDVFGSLVKQWSLQQAAADADWLIGAEVFTPDIKGDALRSLKAPGTAYDNDIFGKDPQPDHMDKFVHLPDTDDNDNGGVHINSGIPNKAFYLAATNIGGFAWEAAGHIWYESLKASGVKTKFQDFADTTYLKAGQIFGMGSPEQQGILSAWRQVGVRVTGAMAGAGLSRSISSGSPGGMSYDQDTAAGLKKKVEALSVQVKSLADDLNALKSKK
jgi:Zn-dependent metalloprotease